MNDTPSPAVTELWLVRHGETVGGSSTRLYGSTDLALSDVGRRQMERVHGVVEGVAFDRVITSPLRRSREAAAIVHPAARPPASVVEAFTEIDFGDWEGLTADEVAAQFPAEHGRWRAGSADWAFPGGENRAAFRARVLAGIEEHLAAANARTLLVLHKGVVKIIVGALLGEAPEVYAGRPCELGSVHVLEREGDGAWRLRGSCLVNHLGPDRFPRSR
jgi:broad specificity phosphatase PhoE